MLSKTLLFTLLIGTFVVKSNGSEGCVKKKDWHSACGEGCTGTPACFYKKCGNVDNVCYCSCDGEWFKCKTSALGYKWNSGAKLSNGSYAFNGTKGDGKHYICA